MINLETKISEEAVNIKYIKNSEKMQNNLFLQSLQLIILLKQKILLVIVIILYKKKTLQFNYLKYEL